MGAWIDREAYLVSEVDAALAEKEQDWQTKYDLQTADYEQKWGLSMRQDEQIAALTERLSQTVSCVDYKQQTCTLCTALTAEKTEIQRARIGDTEIIGKWQCEAERLTAENRRLREMMSVMPKLPSRKEDELKEGKIYLHIECKECLNRQQAGHEVSLAEKEIESDEEIGRWQQEIYKLVIDLSGHEVDGSGCDSGDPLDLTLSEIREGFSFLKDALAEKDKKLRAETG